MADEFIRFVVHFPMCPRWEGKEGPCDCRERELEAVRRARAEPTLEIRLSSIMARIEKLLDIGQRAKSAREDDTPSMDGISPFELSLITGALSDIGLYPDGPPPDYIVAEFSKQLRAIVKSFPDRIERILSAEQLERYHRAIRAQLASDMYQQYGFTKTYAQHFKDEAKRSRDAITR